MKKSSFLTFIFALIPGAGHMYLGLMKKGTSLMTIFFACIAVIGLLRIESFAFLLPIIWFYAFFDTFNMRYLTPEQFREEDQFFFGSATFLPENVKALLQKQHKLFGGICIILGLYILWDNFSGTLYQLLGEYYFVYAMLDSIPTLAISLIIIFVGIYLIRGKKASSTRMLEQRADFKEFGKKE